MIISAMVDDPMNMCNIDTKGVVSEVSDMVPIEVRKKRGRKPNGGKIISKPPELVTPVGFQPLVILHLKCKIQDLTAPVVNAIYEPYVSDRVQYKSVSDESMDVCGFGSIEGDSVRLTEKLRELEHNLHTNNMNDQKSACFHCTYNFDNTQFYIPKCYTADGYKMYGCFCSPECAVSYLFGESLDNSVKFERYAMLNQVYGCIGSHTQNIKPAPNPYYTLSRFYGNLSIQEYRALLKKDRLFMIVDKPISRVMPELYDDSANMMYIHLNHSTKGNSGSGSGSSSGPQKKTDTTTTNKHNMFSTW